MSGPSLCSCLQQQQLLSTTSLSLSSLRAARHQLHWELPTASHLVHSPWGSRTLAKLTINRALKKITLKRFLLRAAILLKQSHFLRKALTAMTFFMLFLEQHSLKLEALLCGAHFALTFLFCFSFQPGCGVSFPCLISLTPDNRGNIQSARLFQCVARLLAKPSLASKLFRAESVAVSVVNLGFQSPPGVKVAPFSSY